MQRPNSFDRFIGEFQTALTTDDVDLCNKPTSFHAQGLQIGSTVPGSWRISVQGGGKTCNNTKFLIQYRDTTNNWVTKGMFEST